MNIGIYVVTNLSNNKKYVGSSGKLNVRWSQHRERLRNQAHCNIHFQRAYNKDGVASFVYTILEYCRKEELLEKEAWWIEELKTYLPEFGYNLCRYPRASRLGCKARPETLLKMSQSNKGENHPMWGKTHSEEYKQKLSLRLKGIAKPKSGKRKTYRLLSPKGQIVEFTGLRDFCRKNKLSLSHIIRVIQLKSPACQDWKLP